MLLVHRKARADFWQSPDQICLLAAS